MGITSVGVGSGLNLEDLITKMVDAERGPAEGRLDLREARTEATISALGALKASLADFQKSLAKLKDVSNFNARSAISTDPTLFSVTADSTADVGTHAIEVLQLAKTHKLASAGFDGPTGIVGNGTLSISVGGQSFDVQIEPGVSDTVAGVRDAINNAAGNTGVRASLLTVSDGAGGSATRLVLTSEKSGSEGEITVSSSGDADNSGGLGLSRLDYQPGSPGSMTVSSIAQDAKITVDGFEVVSSTNDFADAIPGVTITALKAGDDVDAPLSGQLIVSENKVGVKTAIESFVGNYNALMTVFNELTDYDPGTDTRGLMSGDASVSLMESNIRNVLGSTVEGAAADFNSLAFLGIATNRDGSISLDDEVITEVLKTRYEDVASLFSGETGVAARMDNEISRLMAAGGTFDVRNETLQTQQRQITEERDKLELRLEKFEARYRSKFAALDILVSQLNSTGDFLMQQLEATAKIINREK